MAMRAALTIPRKIHLRGEQQGHRETTKGFQAISAAVALVLLLALSANAGAASLTQCSIRLRLSGLSVLHKAVGEGLVTCENGQLVSVSISVTGANLSAGKNELGGLNGKFSRVRDISELFGSYVLAEANAGSVTSAIVLTKGALTLSLPIKGEGWDVGSGVRKLTIEPGKTAIVQERKPNSTVVKVFYATDRALVPGNHLDYGPSRASTLSFGRFDVSVPKDHRLARIERPSMWRFEFSEDPKKHFVIVAREAAGEREFYREAGAAVTASSRREAFVFVHGFNVGFDDAVYRTAQLAYDLEFSGAAILYSWPSNDRLADYVGDLSNNEWTVPHLKSFLESVASRTGARIVHLIAHSMGNRALSNALAQIASAQTSNPRPHFRQVVLTAPDIDVDTFKALSISLKSTADRVTLYASSNDKALLASKRLTGYPRAGDVSGKIVIISGVDTIDVSAVDTDFVGHSYYGDQRSLLADMFSLLSDGKPPGQRYGLQEIRVVAGTYWRFRP